MKKNAVILDACCAGKSFWFDKENENVIFVDKRAFNREEIWRSKDGSEVRYMEVKPDIIADFQDLPFEDNSFYHVVFDPPHLLDAGETSWLAKKYGRLEKNWKELIKNGFVECMRVLKPFGTLIFKWNEEDIKLSEILKLLPIKPLYGHRSGKNNKTIWLAFMKF